MAWLDDQHRDDGLVIRKTFSGNWLIISADPDEIVVCAARTADRFRVPLVTPPAEGDPKAVDALGERERLLAVPFTR